MKTATDQRIVDMKRIYKMHSTDLRARQIVDMCVAKALNERGEPDERNAKRYAADIATEAVSALLLYIYDDDGEINRLAVERDHYKRIAEESLLFTAPRITIASICDSDTRPKAGDGKQGSTRE
jgi:transposase